MQDRDINDEEKCQTEKLCESRRECNVIYPYTHPDNEKLMFFICDFIFIHALDFYSYL